MAFDQSKYIQDYTKEHYDRVTLRLPKGKKALLQEEARIRDITDIKGKVSVNRLIINALEYTYGLDLREHD